MSDDANLTPEQEADLRRLLAEARHEDPMPDDVVSRLDRVLAQLAAGNSDLDPDTVVELASRRRRVASTLLVAAAAVVAIGVGLGQVIPVGDSADDAGTTSLSADAPQAESADGGDMSDQFSAKLLREAVGAPLSNVRSRHFATDIRHVGVRFGLAVVPLSGASAYETSSDSAPSGEATPAPQDGNGDADETESNEDSVRSSDSAKSTYECGAGPYGQGRLVPVLYDGDPAVLAFRRPMGDSRVVDLLGCGTGDILRSVTLARP